MELSADRPLQPDVSGPCRVSFVEKAAQARMVLMLRRAAPVSFVHPKPQLAKLS